MTRRWLCAVVGVGGAAVLASGAAAAPSPQALRTGAVTRSGTTVRVIVAVPALLSGRPVPVKAFTVKDRGVLLPAQVSRLPLAGAELTVIVDVPADDASRLPVVRGAISDFVFHLPPQIKVAIVPAGASTSAAPTADRAAAETGLRAVRPQGQTLMGAAISPVLGAAAARGEARSVVVIVSARSRDFGGGLPNIGAGRPTVYALVPPAGANSVAAVAALKSFGTATQWRTPDGLLSALDDVTADVAGQYEVAFESPGGSGSVEIAAEYAGIRASTVITVPVVPAPAATVAAPAATVAASAAPATAAAPAATTAPVSSNPGSGGATSTDPVQRAPIVTEPGKAGKGLGGTLALAALALVGWFALIGGVALLRQRRQREAGFHVGLPAHVEVGKGGASPLVIDLTERLQGHTPDLPSQSRPSGD